MPRTPTCYQPWHCDSCDAIGTVEYLATEDAGAVKAEAQEEHKESSPECQGPVRFANAVTGP